MPFTPSHVAAILPFARTPLPPAALAIGAMAPDIPYFLPVWVDRDISHSLIGVPTIDLLVGALSFALWILVLRAPVLDYSPAWLRERMTTTARVGNPVLVVVALVLGTLTHLLLDSFTHEGGFLETIAPITSTEVGTFSIANIIHAIVSVLTTLIVVLWVRGWVRRTPRQLRESRVTERARVVAWAVLLSVVVTVGLVAWGLGIWQGRHPLDPNLMGASFFIAVAVGLAATLVLALLWRLRRVL